MANDRAIKVLAPADPDAAAPSSADAGTTRSELEVSISIRTIVLIAAAAALAWALVSIASVLLVIFVSVFCIAVLLPVVNAMERRLGWSRSVCSIVLVLGIVLVILVVVLVLAQAASAAVRDLSHDVPHILDKVRHSGVGNALGGGNNSLDTLKAHARAITGSAGKVSSGVAHVGLSAVGAVTAFFSVLFLTLFGLVDEPRVRRWTGSMMYRERREQYLRITDRVIESTSRYMLGNLGISVICGTVYGITALILDVPHPLALALIAGILDLIPSVGATIAGLIIALVALSVSPGTAIAFLIVIVVYQQAENYILQPTIIGKAAEVSGFTVLVSVLAFGALFGLIGAIIGVPIAAAIQIVTAELTATRRARIAAADAAATEPA
jgi:predicted PurR-regulated permease PerM